MIRTKKRHRLVAGVISAFSLVVLLSSFMTVAAYNEEFAGGDGTEEKPYLIENQDHLDCVRNHPDAHFMMIEDVTFTAEDFSETGFFWQGWTPIGDETTPFTGTFDGNGHKISGLCQDTSASEKAYAGLFGYTDSASIKNLSMDGSDLAVSTTGGSAYAGGIVGYAYNTTIENCANYGAVAAATTSTNATYALAGGITGFAKNTEIIGCHNAGMITATKGNSPYSHGAGAFAGGTAGCLIRNCYNTGTICVVCTGNSSSCVHNMPFAGVKFASSVSGVQSCTVETSYNIGKLLGRRDIADYEDYCVYYNHEGTCVELSVAEMCSQLTYEGFDFTEVWQMGNRDTYLLPTLRTLSHPSVPENTTDFDGGTGMVFDPYLVSTKTQLDNVCKYPQSYFKLTEDIVFQDSDFAENSAFYNAGQGWIAIGDDETPFSGTFDGNGHTIRGLCQTTTKEHSAYYGLFGYTEGIEIKDLTVADSSITAGSSQKGTYVRAGFLVGHTTNATLENCISTGAMNVSLGNTYVYIGGILGGGNPVNIKGCTNAGSITFTGKGNAYIGGILGNGSGMITDCRNMGAISSKAGAGMVGGILAKGTDNRSTITNCINTGTMYLTGQYSGGTGDVGGIAARGGVCTITKCYNAGSVTVGSFEYNVLAGGIAGHTASGSQISDCYNTGAIASSNGKTPSAYSGGIAGYASSGTISNCYNTAEVTAKAGGTTLAGAIVGSNSSTITNCYYLNNCSSGVGSGTDTAVQYNDAQMKKARMYEGFDFTEVWQMGDGGSYEYPTLKGLPAGHTLYQTAEVEATCTEEGNTAYWTCAICNQHFSDAEGTAVIETDSWIIPSKDHDYEMTDSDEATCEEDGYQTYVCKHDATHTYTEPTTKLGHIRETVPAVEPSCEGTGLTAGEKCSRCGETLVAQEVIDPNGHTDADDDEDHSCDVCGKENVSPHTPGGEWQKDGTSHWQVCTVSGCGEAVEDTKVSHIPDHEGGATEEYAVNCTVCGYLMEQQLVHSHTFDKQVLDDKYLKSSADCEQAAVYYYSCRCGESGTETFVSGSAKGHTYIYGVCHCGDDILPVIVWDEDAGTVALEEVPDEVDIVILAAYAGEKMIYCAFGVDEPIEIPVAVLEQADCVKVFYLNSRYAPVLLAGYQSLT